MLDMSSLRSDHYDHYFYFCIWFLFIYLCGMNPAMRGTSDED